jgi:hypothetical protein
MKTLALSAMVGIAFVGLLSLTSSKTPAPDRGVVHGDRELKARAQ